MNVLLADDEPVALERLQLALSCVPEARLVAAARNGKEALTLIRELKPDVAVLDVQMPIKDGFAVLESLAPGDHVPEVIFVTAFDDYAVRAFEVQAVDYLLKPVAFERFREALRRARGRLDTRAGDERFAQLQRLLEAVRADQSQSASHAAPEIWVQERGSLVKVAVAAIDRIEADGDYVRIHVGDASHLVKETITAIQDRLDANFARVHRSSIVNLKRVRSVRRRLPRGLLLVLDGGITVAVGPSYANEIRERIRTHRWRAS
jgi:DNA-binding LytR/AlgR family response regulator